MIQIDFSSNDLQYKSVRKQDLIILDKWLKENVEDDNINLSLDNEIFYRRFLEYYITDDECFIEIYYKNSIIAGFKGRIEYSENNKLVIWFFIMDKKKRNQGLGSKVIELVVEYFKKNFDIREIQVGVAGSNAKGIAFWSSMGFDIARITKNFFGNDSNNKNDLIVMNKLA